MLQRKAQQVSFDPMIIPRVKQYLEENVHQTYVDVGVMARELQQRYREYNRRKAVPFRLLVEHAYRTVLHSYGLDSNPSSENDEEALSDVEVMDETGAGRNQMSSTLTNMYMGRGNRSPATSTVAGGGPVNQSGAAVGEAIDISSDDEEQQATAEGDEQANFISTHVASNKHVTVTKVTRANKVREDETSNESIESSNGKNIAPETKRRRMDNGAPITMQLLSNIRNDSHANINPSSLAAAPTNKKPSTANYQPTVGGKAKRYRKEVVARTVSTTFADVGGMDRLLKELCELLLHVKHPEIYRQIGLPPPRGFLLHGPPGSGKTLLAQAIAGQLKVDLIEIPATELIAGVSGESEERIRDVFEQAAAMSPCVLFIDEIDAISSNRINAQKDMERRIVAQLLSSLDTLGTLEGGEGVIVIGATNRADALDPALRRVGRFDQEISLGIPDREARQQILKIICRKLKMANNLDYGELAKLTPGYVGADLLALATRAANTAIKRLFTEQEKRILSNTSKPVSNDTDDVVAIEDEPDEVVNLDDEKDDVANDADENASNEAGVSSTGQKADDDKKDEAEPAVTTSSETETPAVASEPVAKEGETAAAEQTRQMEVDAETAVPEPSTPFSGTGEPAVGVEKAPSMEVDAAEGKIEQLNVPEQAQPEASENHVNGEATDVVVSSVSPEEEATDVTPSIPLLQATMEMTLEKMLDLLLNHQNELSKEELDGLCIQRDDFMESLKTLQPSAKREGFITVPDVTWNDIGSLGDIREELKLAILAPVKYPRRLKLLGLNAPSGVLLCGPPGCGKTLLAKAVANEAGINFISVKGPELLNMYVGESERAVRQCFQRARNSAPCVIFFDEFDSLCPKRSDTKEGSAGTRVVNQLLTEMDGIEERKGVFLMAATNRPDIVDPAILRPGRLDKILYVGLPGTTDRVDILRALTKNRTQPPLDEDVQFERVAALTEGYTGADLAGLVRQASLQTLKDSIVGEGEQEDRDGSTGEKDATEAMLQVHMAHFLEAIRTMKPSVNQEDKKHYEKLRLKYGASNAVC
ncbi:nuclear valosin-containing protein-like [Anopheles bellator]|uniref:nuclear valosin-containing protein-like n=1 Tax=Anopheles bellator TaxID=139047 RepID=UPI002648FF2C|nr:nuclear valosin-containing protein-like [Anopheles bellator]